MGLCCKRAEVYTLADSYAQFQREAQHMQGIDFLVAVDFTYANVLRSRGWGVSAALPKGSLHAPHTADGVTYTPPYELCLRQLERVLAAFQPPEGRVLFCPFTADSMDQTEVPLNGLVAAYRRHADAFNTAGEPRLPRSFGGSMVPVAVTAALERRRFTCLVLLTSGHIADTCQETQMVIDASRYPAVVTTVGIGDGAAAAHQFRVFHYLDEGITASRFDNYHFWALPYYNTASGAVAVQEPRDLEQLTAVEVFAELPGQYRTCERLGYLEALRGE